MEKAEPHPDDDKPFNPDDDQHATWAVHRADMLVAEYVALYGPVRRPDKLSDAIAMLLARICKAEAEHWKGVNYEADMLAKDVDSLGRELKRAREELALFRANTPWMTEEQLSKVRERMS